MGTRHDGLVDYLGDDYPGFVPAGDPAALRSAINRAMSDAGFRNELIDAVALRRERLRDERDSAGAVVAILRG